MSAPTAAAKSQAGSKDASSPAGGASDFAAWPKLRKIAGLMMILNAESAAEMMKGLEEHELEAVTAEMAKFTAIPRETQSRLLQEFSPVVIEAAAAVPCSVNRVQDLLEKSLGSRRAADLIHRVAPSATSVLAMQPIVEMDAPQIFALLRDEQPQMAAMVASHLPVEKAAEVLGRFRPEVCEQIIERLAMLSPTSQDVVESVAATLRQKIGQNRTAVLSHTGGLRAAAQMLNAMPRNISDTVLASLKERNAELDEALRRNMFTFEELERLDTRTLQRILQAVDTQTLTIALKGASDKVKAKLFACISKRAADNVRDELEMMGALKLRDIEAAQSAIIATVRQLESDGAIDLEELRPKRSQ